MMNPARKWRAIWCVALLIVSGWTPCFAKNPITSYFSRLFDESRAEIAVGESLVEAMIVECGGPSRIASSTEYDRALGELSKNVARNSLPYRVFILDNPIPGEIPFPGGPIVLTKGTVALMQSPIERDFVLSRNIHHISLRNPMMVLKRENLYSKMLRVLKKNPSKVDQEQLQKILRSYIKSAAGMDQAKADREAVMGADDPKAMKQAGIDFLKRWSSAVWPVMPWDQFDLPARLKALEALP